MQYREGLYRLTVYSTALGQKPQIANIKDKKKRDTNNKIRESEEATLRK